MLLLGKVVETVSTNGKKTVSLSGYSTSFKQLQLIRTKHYNFLATSPSVSFSKSQLQCCYSQKFAALVLTKLAVQRIDLITCRFSKSFEHKAGICSRV